MSASGAVSGKLKELGSENPVKLLFKYSWPALVAMTLNSLYTVVDRAFIGLGCVVDATAALTLSMPIAMLFTAFGVFVGVGHAAVISIKLGEGDRVACEKLLGQLVLLKILFFFVIPPLIYFNLDAVLDLCGASGVSEAAREFACTYLKIFVFSHVFSHLAFGLSAAIRAEGGAIRSMKCMIVGFGLNLVLDPLFIFTFKLGVAGAAWATNIAMVASFLWVMGYYWRGETAVRLKFKRVWIYPRLFFRAAGIGLAPFLQHFMSAAIAFSLQSSFVKWMPDEAARTAQVASLGVFQSVLLLVFMPMLGAQQGLQPILGYNWGARNYDRVLKALKTGLLVTAVLSFAAFVIQVVPPFNYWMASLFIDSESPEVVAIAARDLQISNMLIWCIFLNVVATTYFQSIGRPVTAIVLSMLRQGVCLLPAIWVLPYFLEDKPLAIWLSMPISDLVCNALTLVPLIAHMRFLRLASERVAQYR